MSCLQPWKKSNQLLSLTTSCAGLCRKSKMWSACVKQAVWQRSIPRHAKEPCSASCMQLDYYKNCKGAYHEPLKENWVCLCTPTVWLDSSANEKWNKESSIMPIPYYQGRSFCFPMSLTSGPKYVNLPYLYSNSAIENHRIVVIRATTFLEDVPQ